MNAKVTVNPRLKSLRELATLDRGDMKRMLVPFDKQFSKDRRKLFSTEGTSGGQKWPALSPRYKKWKRKKHPGKKIMALSGKTRNRFGSRKDPSHVAFFGLKPSPYMAVGAFSNVASYHRKALKKRDVLLQTLRQYQVHQENIRDYIVNIKLKRIRRAMQSGARW